MLLEINEINYILKQNTIIYHRCNVDVYWPSPR